ncbi:FtsX-like permease family protein [Rhodocytophaga rosea]|uniref:FtsX-like permease family protein n=1 Tax=Rhodocytophaga rosea TaxID=2704465 RepID=A0A6C0GCD6_9BACT|nr:ABC transporter permease [Rhodocytophaga rosea]QHT65557.1 FtsX-like permease family protein [Rhodocytophaga rosea]
MAATDKKHIPPRWAEKLLEWYCPAESLEEVQGDLQELYIYWVDTHGKSEANRCYIWCAFRLARPFQQKQPIRSHLQPNTFGMISHYLKIALRNTSRQKAFSFINISGLALGLACSLLIGLYVQDEYSYDRHWTNSGRIFRLNQTSRFEQEQKASTVALPAGPAIARSVTGVEAVTRLFIRSGSIQILANQGQKARLFQEREVAMVDSSFFKVFSLPLLYGNPATALNTPASVVISREMAQKYFGDSNPMGKVLRYENIADLTITGVFADLPRNTDFTFDFLVNFDILFAVEQPSIAEFMQKDWLYNPAEIFLKLSPASSTAQVEAQFPKLLEQSGDDRVKAHIQYYLQALPEVHLYSGELIGVPSRGSIQFVVLLSAIAGLTLLVACFNYINLNTAQALRRAKEVGLRKTLGAARSQLVGQFMGEAFLQSILAFCLAILLAYILLPFLNELGDKQYVFPDFLHPQLLLFATALLVLTALLSGAYPALFTSGFLPVVALRGKISQAVSNKQRLRQVLVIVQFSVTLVLITATIVIYQQVSYLRNKPLGFQKEQVVVIPLFGSGNSVNISQGVDGPFRMRMNTFEQALSQNIRIQGSTALSAMPGSGYLRSLVVPEGYTEQSNIFVSWVSVDYDFLPTLHIPFLAGRNFSKETGTDHLQAFVINESAARTFGYASAEEAVGRPIQRGGEGGKKGIIIGVVNDFNFNSLDQPMEPLIIDIEVPRFGVFAVTIASDHIPETLAQLKEQWEAFFPERVFEYTFLDENLDAQYNRQEKLSRLLSVFSGLSILISCLGLFGLAAYITYQRSHEIGIRKVLGASTGSLVALLSRDFIRLVLLANLIAIPLGWYLLHQWLETFANRISLQPWVFIGVGVCTLLIAFLTVSSQTFKASAMNPVKTIRRE